MTFLSIRMEQEKTELARQLLDVLDDATIAAKTGLDMTFIAELRRSAIE